VATEQHRRCERNRQPAAVGNRAHPTRPHRLSRRTGDGRHWLNRSLIAAVRRPHDLLVPRPTRTPSQAELAASSAWFSSPAVTRPHPRRRADAAESLNRTRAAAVQGVAHLKLDILTRRTRCCAREPPAPLVDASLSAAADPMGTFVHHSCGQVPERADASVAAVLHHETREVVPGGYPAMCARSGCNCVVTSAALI
jgi:hypothetical protein